MSLSGVRKSIVLWWHGSAMPVVESAGLQKYVRELVIVGGGCVLIVGSFWGYRHYVAYQEAAAQIALAQGIQAYHEASQGGSIRWEQADLLLQNGYETNQKSSLAPYFLVYKADVQVKLGKLPEAIATLDSAISQLPKDSPFLHLYRLEQALMRLDLQDEAAQKIGLESLHVLAYDKENKNSDAALYFLGLYYWDKDDIEQAIKIWRDLVASTVSKERLGESPWMQLAREKLVASDAELAA